MGDLTKNFSRYEVACKCGECKGLPEDPYLLEVFMYRLNDLQKIRDKYGDRIDLSSGYRCPKHNSSVSKTGLNGPHTKAAFDIKASGTSAHRILLAALSIQHIPTGIGISQKGDHDARFIHVDWIEGAGRPWIWSY